MIVSNDLEHVKLKVETEYYECFITFNANNTGMVEYAHRERTLFSHSLKLGIAKRLFPVHSELGAFLLGYFYAAVNKHLVEPVQTFEEDVLESFELYFVHGQRPEFDRLIKLFILTEPDLEKQIHTPFRLVFVRTLIAKAPYIEADDPEYYSSERLSKLLSLVIKEHLPYGNTSFYDDNFHHPVQGALCYPLEEIFNVGVREKMAAYHNLRQWLIERQQNPADFGLDQWEKIV
jgi:hypothetical protein